MKWCRTWWWCIERRTSIQFGDRWCTLVARWWTCSLVRRTIAHLQNNDAWWRASTSYASAEKYVDVMFALIVVGTSSSSSS